MPPTWPDAKALLVLRRLLWQLRPVAGVLADESDTALIQH